MDGGEAHRVPTLLASRGVSQVVTYPAAAIDHTLRLIDAHPALSLAFGMSESHAAWTALAMAEVGGQRTAVVLPAGFSLPLLGPIVGHAVEQHLPVDVLCVGHDPLMTPLPAWWPVTTLGQLGGERATPHDGPLIVVEHRPEAHAATPPPNAPPNPAATALPLTVSADWLAEQRDAGRTPVVALPPPLHPHRRQLEQVALDWQLPVVTCGGADPFAREHPGLWLGRTGFVPSPAAVELLGPADRAAVIAAADARLPPWIGSRVAARATNPAAAASTSTPGLPDDRSPGLTAITELAERYPDAWFVADAGAAHRYVAGAVANAGRPALLTDGLTLMGWSLPTTLGASLAAPERRWVTVLGDGAALMHGTALAALAQHRVPAAVVLFDNGTLGARYEAPAGLRDRARLPSVDWVAFGASLGVEGARWRPGHEPVPPGVERARAERQPFLLVVSTPPAHPDAQQFPVVIDDVDALLDDSEPS